MTTATKERPILFSVEMVRAILAGRKTVTRRVIKGAPTNPESYLLGVHKGTWGIHADVEKDEGVWRGRCPYGRPGDRLWVRETWQAYLDDPVFEHRANVFYRANESDPKTLPISGRWRPSIHMPRWASRITLEVVSVRVERLQEITEAEAKAEGITKALVSGIAPGEFHRAGFAQLWDQLNASRGYSWESNPWVWRVEFSRMKGD